MKTSIRFTALALLAWLTAPAQADVIMEWSARTDALAIEQRQIPTLHARTLALVHVAMFEAVNAIEPRYQSYRLKLVTDRRTSPELAAAAAAHAMLTALFPAQQALLDSQLAPVVNAVPEGPRRARALLLGRKAAEELLALRAQDGSEIAETWRPATPPGVYIPTTIPLASTVPGYRPWVMSSAAQFRPAPPPALDSETWTRDLAEIREQGGATSSRRTAEQTAIAKFWFLNGPRTYNPIVQQVALAKQLDLLDCARLYALVSLAAQDSFIAVFDAKYAFNFWRPVTAIRHAQASSWLPLGDTPMHPEYPCAHCISSAAVATVLMGLAGDEFAEITLTSPMSPGVIRRWTRLSDYRDEVSNARVWAGFHYRFSTEVGKDMGRKIGELTLATQLRPRK